MTDNLRFTEGDFIEVTPKKGTPDFGVVRGTALTSRAHTGWSYFEVSVPFATDFPVVVGFNLNHVDVKNLFRADHAREMTD